MKKAPLALAAMLLSCLTGCNADEKGMKTEVVFHIPNEYTLIRMYNVDPKISDNEAKQIAVKLSEEMDIGFLRRYAYS